MKRGVVGNLVTAQGTGGLATQLGGLRAVAGHLLQEIWVGSPAQHACQLEEGQQGLRRVGVAHFAVAADQGVECQAHLPESTAPQLVEGGCNDRQKFLAVLGTENALEGGQIGGPPGQGTQHSDAGFAPLEAFRPLRQSLVPRDRGHE
jgi:hypothetical protein